MSSKETSTKLIFGANNGNLTVNNANRIKNTYIDNVHKNDSVQEKEKGKSGLIGDKIR